MANLKISLDGKVISEFLLLKERTRIGRNPQNDICLNDLAISSKHAEVITADDCFIIKDLHSTNGTLVNGERVSKHLLRENDVIQLGTFSLTYSCDQNSHDNKDNQAVSPEVSTSEPATSQPAIDYSEIVEAYDALRVSPNVSFDLVRQAYQSLKARAKDEEQITRLDSAYRILAKHGADAYLKKSRVYLPNEKSNAIQPKETVVEPTKEHSFSNNNQAITPISIEFSQIPRQDQSPGDPYSITVQCFSAMNDGSKLTDDHVFSTRYITIGRSKDNDIIIDSPTISSHHARLDTVKRYIQACDGESTIYARVQRENSEEYEWQRVMKSSLESEEPSPYSSYMKPFYLGESPVPERPVLRVCLIIKCIDDENHARYIESSTKPPEQIVYTPPPQVAPVTTQIAQNEEPAILCPKCGSKHITSDTKGFSLGKAALGVALAGGVLMGFVGSKTVMLMCMKCGNRWKAGS